MLLFCQLLKVVAGGILEYVKIKFRYNGQGMVEDIGLDCFVIGPGLVLAKDIYLHR